MDDQERPARRPDWCPGCGSWNVRAVMAGAAANFLCRECGRCWHPEGNGFVRVNPSECLGCPSHPVCLRRWWEQVEGVGATRHGHDNHDHAHHSERWP